MQLDPALQSAADNYKLLTNLVVPRPIAWVTSQNQFGVVNLAPFSFFNAVGSNPLYVVISVGKRDNGEPKDTAKNIQASGEFVVNMVTEDLFDAMNISAADFPADHSELDATHLATAPSVHVKVPRIEQAQVSLECKLFNTMALGDNTLIIGEVVNQATKAQRRRQTTQRDPTARAAHAAYMVTRASIADAASPEGRRCLSAAERQVLAHARKAAAEASGGPGGKQAP